MLGMKENLIDMLGSVFANRQTESNAKALTVQGYKEEKEKYNSAFYKLHEQDRKNTFVIESAGNAMSGIEVSEAYYLGLQDGFAITQLLTQKETPFCVIEREAVEKVEASMPQDKPFILRPYGLRSTVGDGRKEAS